MNSTVEVEFREFVAARLNHLSRFAYVLCRDWHQAEDVVQKALSRLYRKWTKVESGAPDAYVRRIIVNLVHEDHRRAWFRRERPSDDLPDTGYGDPADTGALRVTVLDALHRLPKRQQLAVVLRHWEDMSVEQTALIMGCSAGNVKSQTARGLQTLRGLLGEQAPTQAKEVQR